MLTILSIAVPTYNRPEKIKKLYMDFLSKVINEFGDEVELIVCDNSDILQAKLNQSLFEETGVRYYKNKENLGFSGNMIQCVKKSQGEFIWIISDDDIVNYQAFANFVIWLKESDVVCYNAIMMPFFHVNEKGERKLVNTTKEWKGKRNLKAMIEECENVPFVLFSGVMVRNQKEDREQRLDKVLREFSGNDFIQIPLFIELIGEDGEVEFYSEGIQTYQESTQIRFSLYSMVHSMSKAILFIQDKLQVSDHKISLLYQRCHYQRWMQWILFHKVGRCNINDAERSIYPLLWHWRYKHFSSLRNFLLAFFCILPEKFAKLVCKFIIKR